MHDSILQLLQKLRNASKYFLCLVEIWQQNIFRRLNIFFKVGQACIFFVENKRIWLDNYSHVHMWAIGRGPSLNSGSFFKFLLERKLIITIKKLKTLPAPPPSGLVHTIFYVEKHVNEFADWSQSLGVFYPRCLFTVVVYFDQLLGVCAPESWWKHTFFTICYTFLYYFHQKRRNNMWKEEKIS